MINNMKNALEAYKTLVSNVITSWFRKTKPYKTKYILVRFEVFTAVTMKNGVFWDVMPCGFCKNRRFGGM
jgi:hypothetical protein